MKQLLLTVFAGTLLFASSCTKTGPQGPSGPAGPQGNTGNANVIGSNPFTVYDWTWDATLGAFYAFFNYDAITSAVADGGMVMVYKQYSDGNWTNLPETNGKTITYFVFKQGQYEIDVYNTDGTVPAYPGTIVFRVVVIPSSLRLANPNANWKDYQQTMQIIEQAKTEAASL